MNYLSSAWFWRATTPAVTPPAVVAQPKVYTNAGTIGNMMIEVERKDDKPALFAAT